MQCVVCDAETDEPIEGCGRLDPGVPDPEILVVRHRDGQRRLRV